MYHEDWPKNELELSEYEALIALDYRNKEAKFNIKKILLNTVDYQHIESNRLNNILNSNLEVALSWKIETYQYGTRYGISTAVPTKFNFTFSQPIETSIHKSSTYHTDKGIYDKLEKTLNSQLTNIRDLQTLILDFHSRGDLVFCYNHDIDEFKKYYNDDNSEFNFHITDIHGKINKEAFMNTLGL